MLAAGLTEADMNKPQVGIASMWYEGNPCNMHLLNLAEEVKRGVVSGRGREGIKCMRYWIKCMFGVVGRGVERAVESSGQQWRTQQLLLFGGGGRAQRGNSCCWGQGQQREMR